MTYSLNDNETLFATNQLSNIDEIMLICFNTLKNTDGNKLRFTLLAFDNDGNNIFGPKVT